MGGHIDLQTVALELQRLQERVARLEVENAALRREAARPKGPELSHAPAAAEDVEGLRVSRRGWLSGASALAAGALAACTGEAGSVRASDGGPDADNGPGDPDAATSSCECPEVENVLVRGMAFDEPLESPQVLDTSVHWKRRHLDPAPGYVSTILTLEQEGQGPNSYPWPLFVKVTGTPDNTATITSANAFGVNARLINPGSGFGAAFFSDLQHGGGGTDIGYACELISRNPNGRSIGLNILHAGTAEEETNHMGSQAINIQSGPGNRGWKTGILLEKVPSSTKAGETGIAIEGQYDVGLDMTTNNIKMTRGSKIYFDENETLFMWLNPDLNRVELRYLNNVLQFWDF